MKHKPLFLLPLLSLTLVGAASSSPLVAEGEKERPGSWVKRGLDIPDEDTQYLGYGYNVLAGKAISDPDALLLAHPILDVDNPALLSYAKAYSASQTTYLSHTTSSTKELAETYGTTLSGGINAKIKAVTTNISTIFNTSSSFSTKAQEEYSYYSIYAKNRTVLLQAGPSVITSFLSDAFKQDVLAIESETDAAKLFSRYGTHLLTGYNLGGIFEMTNYYASRSSTYQRQNSLGFSAQVDVALGSYGGGTNFSFANEFGANDNNAYAVNNYKCTTYGGHVFPGLTINQAFQWYETAFKAGFVYDIWTDSINRGENLSIVSVPQSSEMLPLWSLLPALPEYDAPKANLISAYIKEAGITYAEFLAKYPDVNHARRPIKVPAGELGYLGIGLELYSPTHDVDKPESKNYSYVKQEDIGSTITAFPGSLFAFDYDPTFYLGRELRWSISGSGADPDVTILDERNGVFAIDSNVENERTITIFLTLDGEEDSVIYTVDLNILPESTFAGGQGTEGSPFLINNADHLHHFLSNPDKYGNSCFLLQDNIAINGYDADLRIDAFNGTFDGAYHTISGLRLAKENAGNATGPEYRRGFGFFGYNSGTIKNLNLAYDGTSSDVNFTNVSIEESAAVVNGEDSSFYVENVVDAYSAYGGLVGINDGVIESCTVSNANMEILSSRDQEWLCVGSLVGNNRGAIRNSLASNCSLKLHGRAKFGEGATQVAVGGLVGRSGVTAKRGDGGINGELTGSGSEFCSAEIKSYGRATSKKHALFAGGLVGHLGLLRPDKDTIQKVTATKECLVRSYSVKGNFTDDAHLKETIVCGAFIGFVDNYYTYPIFTSSLVYETPTDFGVFTQENTVASSRLAVTLAAFHDANSIKDAFLFEDFVYDTRGTLHLVNDADSPSDNTSYYEAGCAGLLKVEGMVFNNLPDAIRNSSRFVNVSGHPALPVTTASSGSVHFDLTDAKKRFYVGDAFSAGSITATYETSDGEEQSTSNITIDSSGFDSSRPTTCIIRVEAMGESVVYTVTVVIPGVIGIEFDTSEWVGKDESYASGEVVSLEGLKVKEVTENLVGGDEVTAKVEFVNADEPLVNGLNLLEAVYVDPSSGKEYRASLPIDAKNNVTTGLEVVSSDPAQLKLPIGSTKIDRKLLAGMKINVSASESSYLLDFQSDKVRDGKLTVVPSQARETTTRPYDIPLSEVEFYFSPIRAGDNKVTVCFDGYLTDEKSQGSFTVEGVASAESQTLADFVAAVDAIPLTASLPERYVALTHALALKKLVQGEDEETFVIAAQLLDEYLAQYNEAVKGVNDHFATSLQITARAQLGLLLPHGYYVLPALIYLALLIL